MSLSFGSAAARSTPPHPPAIRTTLRQSATVAGLAGLAVLALALAAREDLDASWLLVPLVVAGILSEPATGRWPRPAVVAAISAAIAVGTAGALASSGAAAGGALLFLALGMAIGVRAEGAGPLTRRQLAPVGMLALGYATALAVAVGFDAGTRATGWLAPLALAGLAIAVIAARTTERAFAADALERLGRVLSTSPDLRELRHMLSLALRDGDLAVRWRPAGSADWTDENGRPAPPPEGGNGRMVTAVVPAGGGAAAVLHDADLGRDPALLDAVRAHVATALDTRRLVDQLRRSLDDLSSSRARMAVVADEERRRLERDLHDGAQQRLVVLRIKMELLADELEEDRPESAQRLRELEREVITTIEEVRSIGRGAYPPLLADRGLGDALRAMARNALVATTVAGVPRRRYPREIEGAVYFACVEALQNATKHADAGHIRIQVIDGPDLSFEVRDDGAGFDPDALEHCAGLIHMRDRVSAAGGELDVLSAPGRGTVVRGTIPVAPRAPARA
jgi:signal transduction histidine kinase